MRRGSTIYKAEIKQKHQFSAARSWRLRKKRPGYKAPVPALSIPCMQYTRPLQDHPEFTVRQYQDHREYRVENWRLSRDGSRRVLKSSGWTWFDVAVPVVVALLWRRITYRGHYALLAITVFLYVYAKCTQTLWESVLAIPQSGIQLETHRGLPNTPLFVSRQFIPAIDLREFVINEGLRRWDVRYYLAAVRGARDGKFTLHVAYENTLPYFPVLLHVYRDVHSIMFASEQ
ncbi:hypothetical protein BDW22DRAFT_1358666 [Trametopsis cervina]|nr:hypothetical protein BDW22DRAFT_1358666 [Trametopsis cervina]